MLPAELVGLNAEFDPDLLARIEDAGLNASAPPQQRWFDGWLLRFSHSKAKRARCINAVALGRQPVQQRLAQCVEIFAAAGLPLIVRITPFTLPCTLDAQLAAQGLLRLDDTRVMVLRNLNTVERTVLDAQCSIGEIELDVFAQKVGALRGSSPSQRQAHAERLIYAPVPFTAFELREHNEVVACGQFALEGDLVGLFDIFTAPKARGRGLARLLCQHLLLMARQRGATHAYLQVESDNAAARSVYLRLGFIDGYSYHYRSRDPPAA
ncbi:MAG: GNAT family N-acetyltransferase [Burkholderiaceae bacterium]